MNNARKHPTKAQMRKMAFEVMQYLHDQDMWREVTLYVNGKALTPYQPINQNPVPIQHTKNGIAYYEIDKDVASQVEYSNPDTLTMTFDGELYSAINDNPSGKTMADLDRIFGRYGLYGEQGYAWSLAAWPI